MNDVLLTVKDLKKYFPVKKGIFSRTVSHVHAVDGMSFTLRQGDVLGLVGESGCGKSTTARAILRLVEPTAGQVVYKGREITRLKKGAMRKLRKEMQIIYQDPYSSLNPRLRVGEIVGEMLEIYKACGKSEMIDRVVHLLNQVGLGAKDLRRYPHEFSGGQRQRIGIARALALNPALVIGDEPVSALDLSIRSQILNLLMDLKDKYHLTYIIISHDLGVVAYLCRQICVMYLGQAVEYGPTANVCHQPAHPYTRALISAIPSVKAAAGKKRIILKGDIPSPIAPPGGCRFHPRCDQRQEICERIPPDLRPIEAGHLVACHLA